MKIVSRPEEQVVGSGPYTIKMTYEEIQYIGALAYITRLGNGRYKDAAFKLINTIEELEGEDFLEEASLDVDASFSIVNDQGDIIETVHNAHVCIEV